MAVDAAGSESIAGPWRILGVWAARVALVAVSLWLLRESLVRYQAALETGRAEFSLLEGVASGRGAFAIALAAIAGLAFTLAVRLPIRAGFSLSRAVFALVPVVLIAHLFVLARIEITGGWFGSFYFFDGTIAQWALATMAGVAIGSAIGRSGSSPR